MVCDQCQENLSAFVDGELPSGDTVETFAHMSSCMICTRFFSSTIGVRSLLARETPPVIPRSLDLRMHAIRPVPRHRWENLVQRASAAWQKRIALPLPAAVAIGIVFLLLLTAGVATWMGYVPRGGAEEPVIVYIRELPAVDVYGSVAPETHTENGGHNL